MEQQYNLELVIEIKDVQVLNIAN